MSRRGIETRSALGRTRHLERNRAGPRRLDGELRWPERVLDQECWGWERLAAARTSKWFALRDVKRKTTRLFDLEGDPLELKPVDPAGHPEAAELLRHLDTFVGRRSVDGPAPALDPELVRRLKALGYMDGDG